MPPLPRLPRAFHAVSLAATSIASRTTVRRVRPYRIGYAVQLARPNRFRPYPSGNHGSFRAALRRRRLCADPFGVMQPPSRPPAKAGITPIPSVCTASSRNHVCICRHAFGLSACHSRASEIPLYAFPRRSPSAQVVLSKSKSSLRGVTRSVGGVRHPWVFVPHPTNGTPMSKNANRPATDRPNPRFTEGMARFHPIFRAIVAVIRPENWRALCAGNLRRMGTCTTRRQRASRAKVRRLRQRTHANARKRRKHTQGVTQRNASPRQRHTKRSLTPRHANTPLTTPHRSAAHYASANGDTLGATRRQAEARNRTRGKRSLAPSAMQTRRLQREASDAERGVTNQKRITQGTR